MPIAPPADLKHVGLTIDEWLDRVPNELAVDAVGLWQLVRTIRLGFVLSGERLERYVRLCVAKLIENGALPVQGNTSQGWSVRSDLAGPHAESIEKIVAYWNALDREPDVGDVWFALPKFVDGV